MKGLILKDIEYLKKEWILILAAIVIFSLINIFIGLGISGTQFVFSFVFAVLVNSSFSKDEINNWNEYALTMPISRKDIIKSKYIFSFIAFIIAIFIGTLVGALTNIMAQYGLTREHIAISSLGFSYILLGFIGALTIYTLIVFVNFPISFKEGHAKGKQLTYLAYFVFFILYSMIQKIFKLNLIENILKMPLVISLVFLIFSSLVILGSYFLSIKYFIKKEF
ncbi:MAG: ABC-2 transporter permease [Tissierellia bacterium]|nr:ABC-2 transporter permease [Tissierellia bacterium]